MLRDDENGSLGQSAGFWGVWRKVLWYHAMYQDGTMVLPG